MQNEANMHAVMDVAKSETSDAHAASNGLTRQDANNAPHPIPSRSHPCAERHDLWNTVLQRTTDDSIRVMDDVLNMLHACSDDGVCEDVDTPTVTQLPRQSISEQSTPWVSALTNRPCIQHDGSRTPRTRHVRHAREGKCARHAMSLPDREHLATLFDNLSTSFRALCEVGGSDTLISSFLTEMKKELQKDNQSLIDLTHRMQAACRASSAPHTDSTDTTDTQLCDKTDEDILPDAPSAHVHTSRTQGRPVSPNAAHPSCLAAYTQPSSRADDADEDAHRVNKCVDRRENAACTDGGASTETVLHITQNVDIDEGEDAANEAALLSRSALRQCVRERSDRVARLVDARVPAHGSGFSSDAGVSGRAVTDSVDIGDYLFYRWISRHPSSSNDL